MLALRHEHSSTDAFAIMKASAILQLKSVRVDYRFGQLWVQALKNFDLDLTEGDFVALSGSSGSGKTTLLNVMGLIERPTDGRIFFEGRDLAQADEAWLAHLRAEKIGFVFQTFNLIPVLTALENVEYALLPLAVPSHERTRLARHALDRVGLAELWSRRPDQLSGGQRQRVAIARAIVKKPRLILADEPTANLDSRTAADILALLSDLNRTEGLTVAIASHDVDVLSRVKEVVRIVDGVRVG